MVGSGNFTLNYVYLHDTQFPLQYTTFLCHCPKRISEKAFYFLRHFWLTNSLLKNNVWRHSAYRPAGIRLVSRYGKFSPICYLLTFIILH